jgi:hypothetical protein
MRLRPRLRSALPSQSAVAVADELHGLLMGRPTPPRSMRTLAPSKAFVPVKARLADAFVSLSAGEREMSLYGQDEGEAIGYQEASGVDCGYNKAIGQGYGFAFREPASGRTASVNVEAATGAAMSEQTAHLALWDYRKIGSCLHGSCSAWTAISGAAKPRSATSGTLKRGYPNWGCARRRPTDTETSG